MPLQVRCPNPECARTAAVEPARMGRKFQCAGCGRVFLAHPDPTLVAGASGTKAGSSSGSGAGKFSGPPTAPASLTVSARIGRFVVKAKLGAGAFGTVYRAYDPHLDREVALKVPNPGVVDSPKRVERFLREAKAAANLRHPHIVPVYDAGKDGDRYFIASAFIDGQPLAGAVDDDGTEFRRAARLVRELAEALAYAHGQGVVHRDVKPANAMLDTADHLHLMDFGLAARAEDADEAKLTNDGAVLGTPAYMAPEQAAGQHGDAKPAADQYSAGVVLYELLTGGPPFTGPPAIVIHNAIHTAPEPPGARRAGVPRDLETICLKAMAKAAADRYPDCGALADDLRRYLDGEPITARRQSAAERVVRWAKSNPAVAGLAAAVVVVLAAGAAVSSGFAVSATVQKGRAEQAEAEVRGNLEAVAKAAEEAEKSAALAKAEKATADLARKDAEDRRQDALVAKGDADRAAKAATDANAKTAAALKAATTAEENAKADAERAKAAEAKATAALDDLKKSQAEIARLAYAPLVRSAQQHLDRKARVEARLALDRCPPALRGWEWDYLSAQQSGMFQPVAIPGEPPPPAPRVGYGDLPLSANLSALSADGEQFVYVADRSLLTTRGMSAAASGLSRVPAGAQTAARTLASNTGTWRAVTLSPLGELTADIVGEFVTVTETKVPPPRPAGVKEPETTAYRSLGDKLGPRRVAFLTDSVLAVLTKSGAVVFHRVSATEAAPLPDLTIPRAGGPDDLLATSGDGWLATGAGGVYRVTPNAPAAVGVGLNPPPAAPPPVAPVGENFLKVMRERVSDPTRTVTALAVAPGGRWVAFADNRNGFYLFNPSAKADPLVPVSGNWIAIQRVRFTPDCRRVLFCGRLGPVHVADTDTGEVLLSLTTGVSPVVELGYSKGSNTVLAITADTRLILWKGAGANPFAPKADSGTAGTDPFLPKP